MERLNIELGAGIAQDMLMELMDFSISRNLLDEHFTIVWGSDAYYKYIGYEKEEYAVLFQNRLDIYFKDSPNEWNTIVQKMSYAMDNEIDHFDVVVHMPVKDGFRWTKIAVKFTHQQLDGIGVTYTVMTDVEEIMRRQMEQLITHENLPGFIAKYKLKKNGNFILLEANNKYRNFNGIAWDSSASFSDFTPFSRLDEESRKTLNNNIPLMLKGESVHFVIRSKDLFGKNVWMQMNGSCIGWEKDEPLYLIVYIDLTDITEQRALQKQLEQQSEQLKAALEAAEHANRAKSDFLARMSHDIRTPINAIIGMTDIAHAHINEKERVLDCIMKAKSSSRLLLSLINEILDMAKIESGHFIFSEDEFNIGELLQELIVMMQPEIKSKEQILDIHIKHLKHEYVKGDMHRIKQVLMNIFSNAIKYTAEKGNIKIDMEEKPVDDVKGNYEFVFEDNGRGMRPEFLEKIFDPFERADDKEIRNIQGMGLGMAIGNKIVKMMDGTIKVESEYGKGSRFTINLPLSYGKDTTDVLDGFEGYEVLVVDDDQFVCLSTVNFLNEIGLKSDYAFSGYEGIEKAFHRHEENNDYFAIIMDIKMPGMDGIEATHWIREIIGPDIPIIILSAYDTGEYEEEAKEAKANGFITKPLYRSKLIQILRRFLADVKQEDSPAGFSLSDADYSGKRLLLVEDNELNREIAVEIIGSTGITIDTAVNGLEAFEMVERAPIGYYQLIMMDIQMPVMDGYEATRRIRTISRRDIPDLPIIAMTANAFPEDVANALKAGMNFHLAKPIDIKALMNVLEKYL